MRDPGLREQYKTELQVGVLLVVSFFALILGVAWISGRQPAGDRLVVYALAPEAAAVTQGTPITLLGVEVGSVRQIWLRQDHVGMELVVNFQGQLPRDTRAEIKTSGFLGANVLALIPGVSTELLASGDTITAAPTPGLNELAGTLGDQAGRVLEQTRMLLSDSLISDVHSAAGSLAAGMEDVRVLLEREAGTLQELIEALELAATKLADELARLAGSDRGYGAGVEDAQIRRLSEPHDPVAGGRQTACQGVDLTDVEPAPYGLEANPHLDLRFSS